MLRLPNPFALRRGQAVGSRGPADSARDRCTPLSPALMPPTGHLLDTAETIAPFSQSGPRSLTDDDGLRQGRNRIESRRERSGPGGRSVRR
jgi:hypothetical protein